MTAGGRDRSAARVPRGVPVAVVSPHYDDGVFSCGDLLASHPGSVVVTALGGRARRVMSVTPWDRAAGFRDGDDPVAARRREDRRALHLLGAAPVWLQFPDSQYGGTPPAPRLGRAIAGTLQALGLRWIVVPLGLFHSDHRLTHEAALGALRDRRECRLFVYADALYRRLPGAVDERLRRLAARGWTVRTVRLVPHAASAVKRRAVRCYASQLRALATPGRLGIGDAFDEERYWAVSRR
jgi:LmbE family N-acetylglucosaminyl deacetylase